MRPLHRCALSLLVVAVLTGVAPSAWADERLCDPSFENCRTPLLELIDNETVGIDVAFWFMEDMRYVSHLVSRFRAGVPVRVIVDPRANDAYPVNRDVLDALQQAGIPMRKKAAAGIMHMKMMLFAGQDTVEFGSANYSPDAFVPVAPYENYVAETIYFCDDQAIVGSFKTQFDDLWTDGRNYANYANVTRPTRRYSTYPVAPELNFPPGEDYADRAAGRYRAETRQIDVAMYRPTDGRHTDALIDAWQRGVPVRFLGETREYRDPDRLWVAYNLDRLYAAGIPVRVRASAGENHEKLVLLYDQRLSIFGSSNWTSASANSQQEHNYFSTKPWMFEAFAAEFDRKWRNANPLGAIETRPFEPLPPDPPRAVSPAPDAGAVPAAGAMLTWNGGPWAHTYDIYFGTDPQPPLYKSDRDLGPSGAPGDVQRYPAPPLKAGTTYYWRIVSKTAAGLTASGPVWRFTAR